LTLYRVDEIHCIRVRTCILWQALFQKAETLYIKGNFELALVFYHRGQKLKPDSELFRLGIQKAQEAIDSAVGGKLHLRLFPRRIFFEVLQ